MAKRKAKMRSWIVPIRLEQSATIIVEAADEESAIEQAESLNGEIDETGGELKNWQVCGRPEPNE